MHGTDILNRALIKHLLATGVKGLEDRVGVFRWTIGPHYPSNSCKGWTIRKQLKIHTDQDLLVPGDSSVDYVSASIFSAARYDLKKRQVMWRIAADVNTLAPELSTYEACGRCAVCIQAIAGT